MKSYISQLEKLFTSSSCSSRFLQCCSSWNTCTSFLPLLPPLLLLLLLLEERAGREAGPAGGDPRLLRSPFLFGSDSPPAVSRGELFTEMVSLVESTSRPVTGITATFSLPSSFTFFGSSPPLPLSLPSSSTFCWVTCCYNSVLFSDIHHFHFLASITFTFFLIT